MGVLATWAGVELLMTSTVSLVQIASLIVGVRVVQFVIVMWLFRREFQVPLFDREYIRQSVNRLRTRTSLMLLLFLFILIEVLLLVPTLAVVKRQRLGLYTCFYGVFFALITIPFFLIYMDARGMISMAELVGKSTDAKVTLDVGDGVRPMVLMIMFQACYIAGGYLMSTSGPPPPLSAARLDPRAMQTLAIGLAVFGVAYSLVRFWDRARLPAVCDDQQRRFLCRAARLVV